MVLKKYGIAIFQVVFAVYALTLTVPYGYAELGLDPSWNLAINMLIHQGANFGQEVAFTYGPLGFLNYRILPEGYSIYSFLVFDLAFVGIATASLAFAMRRAGSYAYWVGISAFIFLYPDGLFSDRVFSLLFYELGFLMYAIQERKFVALLPPTIIAILLFFIKVNTLFIAGPYYLFILLYAGIKRIFAWQKLLLLALVYGSSLFALAYYMQVDISSYIANSIELIDGYLDAMALFQLYRNEFLVLALLESLFWCVFIFLILRSQKAWRENGLILGTTSLLLLLLFKQTHVGIGFAGFRNFFQLAPVILLAYMVFVPTLFERFVMRIAGALMLVYFIGMAFTGYGVANRSWSDYVRTRPIPHMNLSYYFIPFTRYQFEKHFDQHALDLPKSIREKIGRGSVDFLQHDLAYVFFNRLHYQPRPVIQSYSAYTPDLIQLNGQHFRSSKAPQWVFYKLEPFRNQNPFWMDSDVSLELLKSYQVQEQVFLHGDTLLLLKKSSVQQKVHPREVTIPHMQLGESVQIPQGGLVRLRVDARLNWIGKLMRLLVQPPYLYAQVKYQDGTSQRFRVIPSILKAGIWVGARVLTQSELRTFFLGAGRQNMPIQSLRFESPQAWAWEK